MGAPLGFTNLVTSQDLSLINMCFFHLQHPQAAPSAGSQIPLCFRPMGSRVTSHNLWPGRCRSRAVVSALCPPAKSTTHQSPGHFNPALALASPQSCRMQYSRIPPHTPVFTAPPRPVLLNAPGVCQAASCLAWLQTHTSSFLHVSSQLQDQATTASAEPAMIQLLAGWENRYVVCISCVHGSILSSSNPCTRQQAYTESKFKKLLKKEILLYLTITPSSDPRHHIWFPL